METLIIYNRLKAYRELLGMKQGEFATFLDVHRVTYNRWENQREQPNLARGYRVWQALNARLPELHMEELFTLDITETA
jgi:DNA-binding XRE family transcriptional regulator